MCVLRGQVSGSSVPLLGETQEDDRRMIAEMVVQKLLALELSASAGRFASASASATASEARSGPVAATSTPLGYSSSAAATSSAASLQSCVTLITSIWSLIREEFFYSYTY